MKFFIDTANLDEIREANELGLIDGVTTNPSLVAKEGNVDFKEQIKKIAEIVKGDIWFQGQSLVGRSSEELRRLRGDRRSARGGAGGAFGAARCACLEAP